MKKFNEEGNATSGSVTMHSLPTYLLPINMPHKRQEMTVAAGGSNMLEKVFHKQTPTKYDEKPDPLMLLVADMLMRKEQFAKAVALLKTRFKDEGSQKYTDDTLQNLWDLNVRIKVTLEEEEDIIETADEESPLVPRIRKNSISFKLKRFLRSTLYDSAFRHAIQLTVAMILVCLVVFVDPLRSIFSGSSWAAITVLMIFEATYGGLIRKSVQRLTGTLIGGIYGTIVLVFLYSLPPTNCLICSYKPVILASSLVIFCFISAWCKISYKRYSYMFVIASLTTTIVLLATYPVHERPTDEPEFWVTYKSAFLRIAMVIFGIFVSFLVSSFILPERASTRFPQLLGKVFVQLSDFLLFIQDSYSSNENFDVFDFRNRAYEYIDVIAEILENLRDLFDQTKHEILLTQKETLIVQHGEACLKATQRMFYIMVSMVYGRIFSENLTFHTEMQSRILVLIDVTDNTMKALGKILQRHHRFSDPEDLLDDPKILVLLNDAIYLCISMFKNETIYEGFVTEFNESEIVTWNHYALSFIQMMVNYTQVLKNVIKIVE